MPATTMYRSRYAFWAWWDGVETEDILARESETNTEEKPKTAQTLVIDDNSDASEKEGALAVRLDVLRRLWGEGVSPCLAEKRSSQT